MSLKFKLLLWVSGAIAAMLMVLACHGLWGYSRLERKMGATIRHWKVMEASSSQYALKAKYSFNFNGRLYRGKTVFSKPYDLNRLSAEKRADAYKNKAWEVYFNPRNPKVSSLEKKFPTKKCLYALMGMGVFFYFLFLDRKFLNEAVQ